MNEAKPTSTSGNETTPSNTSGANYSYFGKDTMNLPFIPPINQIIVKHQQLDNQKDSLEIGSAAKNCCIKVYLDFSNPDECKTKLDEAIRQRTYLMSQINNP